ncbi:MAG: MarR family transcriptional regulator [Roseobacter sp.]|jgi:DNA-binding MarR family transcriptional regulator
MNEDKNSLAIALFTEVMATDQLVRARLSRVLPKGMEISHFSVLNHLAWVSDERTPAQLAETLHVTRGAMTNTLSKLEWAGYVHIRPDWDDARRKLVAISPAGRQARDHAVGSVMPVITQMVDKMGSEQVRNALPILRELRILLGQEI